MRKQNPKATQLDQIILEKQNTHTLAMIHKETGFSKKFIRDRFHVLEILPVTIMELKLKFLIENAHLIPGQQAKALGVTGNYVSQLRKRKVTARVKSILQSNL